MAILDRIKFDGTLAGPQWLIYKEPSDNFVLGSQLIVNQGQEALFFKGGEALDLFGPGTHTLTTGNLPILNKLVNLPFGGKTPFSAEVYFINKTANLELKWGTTTPIPIEDPKYGVILNIGARGQYGISIKDSRTFVSQIIGAIPGGTVTNYQIILKYFNGLINSVIKSVTAEYLIKKNISFLEVSMYLSEISEAFKEKIEEEFERFGIEIINFFCESIAPRPEEYRKLQKYKEELALGGDFYTQRRSLDILEKLADNPSSGSVANAGIGLGMGLGTAGQFGRAFSEIGQSVSTNQDQETVNCPKCGNLNKKSDKFCSNCGEKIIAEITCPNCGSTIPSSSKFCSECGHPIGNKSCSKCGAENPATAKFCSECGNAFS